MLTRGKFLPQGGTHNTNRSLTALIKTNRRVHIEWGKGKYEVPIALFGVQASGLQL
jgi:hypothetical protein